MIPGTLPSDRLVANAGTGDEKSYEYRCMICGGWHVYPQPCPKAGVNEEHGG